jgi:hypothetical protein
VRELVWSYIFFFLLSLGFLEPLRGQSESSIPAEVHRVVENVVLVTLDGLRGEEVFSGAEERLMIKECGVKNVEACKGQFWRESTIDRRRTLMPFLWQMIEEQGGWIAGSGDDGSLVKVSNGHYFSYPGYNEILSGFADPWVNSNDKRYNRNVTVLEWLHQKEEFRQRIAVYGSWDVFPYIVNDRRSGIPVNAGWMELTVGAPGKVEGANFIARNLFHEFEGVRYDSITTLGAIEEIKVNQPRILFVSLGETDDWAHAGRYDNYLLTAWQNDRFLKEMWDTVQSIDAYRDRTLFLVTTDHGRGDGLQGWKNHSVLLSGSERIWIAAFGVPLKQSGIDQGGRYSQSQVAATVAASLGYDFQRSNPKIDRPLPILDLSDLRP